MTTQEDMYKEVMAGQKELAKQLAEVKASQKEVLDNQKDLLAKIKFCQDMVGDSHFQKTLSDQEIERQRKEDIEERDRQFEEIKQLIEGLKAGPKAVDWFIWYTSDMLNYYKVKDHVK